MILTEQQKGWHNMKRQVCVLISGSEKSLEVRVSDLLLKYIYVDLKQISDTSFLFIGEEKDK